MSDVHVKNVTPFQSSDRENNHQQFKKSGVDELACAIARIAVAQVCEGLGFQSFHESALVSLADVGIRYVREIGKCAVSCANSGNRNECNAFDVIQGLEDTCSVHGFPCASDTTSSVQGSGVLGDIARYIHQNEKIPFAYLIPSFPVFKERRANTSFVQAEFSAPVEYIPNWLPKFPNPEAWGVSTTVLKSEMHDKILTFEEMHDWKLERHLYDSHNGTVCDASEVDVVIERPAIESNPFLVQPLQFEEKEISLPICPVKLLRENETTWYRHNHNTVRNHGTVCNGSEVDVAIEVEGQTMQRKSFLTQPLRFAEKEICLPICPAKLLSENETTRYIQNHDILQTHVEHLLPVMPLAEEAVQGSISGLKDERNVLSCHRPNVSLKFRNRKKPLGMASKENFEKTSDEEYGKNVKKMNG